MRVLQLYNNYQSGGGGETRTGRADRAVVNSARTFGTTCTRDNNSIDSAAAKSTPSLQASIRHRRNGMSRGSFRIGARTSSTCITSTLYFLPLFSMLVRKPMSLLS